MRNYREGQAGELNTECQECVNYVIKILRKCSMRRLNAKVFKGKGVRAGLTPHKSTVVRESQDISIIERHPKPFL